MTLRNPEILWLLLLVLPGIAALWYYGRRRVSAVALALRLLIVTLLLMALADPLIGRGQPASGPLLILFDQSDSLTATGKAALWQQARTLAAQAQGPVSAIAFGADTRAVPAEVLLARTTTPSADGCPLGENLCPRADGTNIAEALRTARKLLAGTSGRIVLLSDGNFTGDDPLAEAELARGTGLHVDVLPVVAPTPEEVALVALTVPPTLRVGEQYTIRTLVRSSVATSATLRLFVDDTLVEEQLLQLPAATGEVSTTLRAERPGLQRLRAEILPAVDTFGRNNGAAATAFVAPPPRLLIIEGQPGSAAELRSALREEGIESEAISPGTLPSQLSILDPFDGILLNDVPAGDLTLDQMMTLREFVRSEGRGLVVIGGRNSYGLGGYKGTPLEETLPVTMDPPPKKTRPDVALLLIIDHSASMNEPGITENGDLTSVTKFDMAREAAIQATNTLEGEDRIGVLIFDTRQEWNVPFQQLGEGLSLGQIQDRISNIPLGGGTDIQGALEMGLPALADQESQVRHAILLTDGRSFSTEREPYRELVGAARAQEITLSSIAIGVDSDTALLEDLARWGAGRYHFAAQPEDIPRLTLLESEIARANALVEETFLAELSAPHPLMRDFSPNELPQLKGYVATTVKPEAETVLQSPDEDPLLATWQYGLGRTVAWTPNAAAPWAGDWLDWPKYGRFWAQVVRYSLPQADTGPLQVQLNERGDVTTLQVDALLPSGEPIDLAETEATITLPNGASERIVLRQIAPGRYQQELALSADGSYAISVRQTSGGRTREATTGYVRQVPAEYVTASNGPETLTRIAKISGGQELSDPAALTSTTPEELIPPTALWPWLMLLALVLWPLEIAITKGWLGRV